MPGTGGIVAPGAPQPPATFCQPSGLVTECLAALQGTRLTLRAFSGGFGSTTRRGQGMHPHDGNRQCSEAPPQIAGAEGGGWQYDRVTMRTSLILLFLLPLAALGEEVRITIGMKRDEAVAIIRRHGGVDITPNLAVVGPKGEHPLRGYHWEFRDYDAIVEISPRDGKIERMTYWTKKDFGESKNHRAKTEQNITTLKLDTKTKAVSIEKPKPKKTAA